MSIPLTAAKELEAGGSSLTAVAAGGLEEALGGRRGLIKKSMEVAALTYRASQLGSWVFSRIYHAQKHNSCSHS